MSEVVKTIHIHGKSCGCKWGCLCRGCEACKHADEYESSCDTKGCCKRLRPL